MSGSIYLAPGFLITIAGNGRLKFPHFRNNDQRATPPRVGVINMLNGGYEGCRESLAELLGARHNVPEGNILAFLAMLDEAGYLVDSEPQVRFTGEPAGLREPLGDEPLAIPAPAGLVSESGRFLWYDHEGNLAISLELHEVYAVAMFAQPITGEAAWAKFEQQHRQIPLDRDTFFDIAERLKGARLLRPAKVLDVKVHDEVKLFSVDRSHVQEMVDARVAAHDEAMAIEGRDLFQVVPINTLPGSAPVSLGMVIGYAMEWEGGRLRDKLDFVPMFLTDAERLAERAQRPGVYLFSNYMWNDEQNLEFSAIVKAANPDNITIHGGPSTPKYEKDAQEFFDKYPHVDIAVRGEGEQTLAELLDAIDTDNPTNLDGMREVAGITFRAADGLHRTPDRERIADINTIPSPFKLGLFDEFGSASSSAVVETNRGCPYGCTFCDWGSATLSKVRKFDLDRVFEELEWCARHGIKEASIADANFGMLERDVEITRKIAELRGKYGYPQTVNINYAKNQVRYLKDIIEIMASANILAEGVVSLQTTDAQTLEVIDRSNIKLEKYNELSTEFRQSRLPLAADIMMGLPGATPSAFMNDLQMCTDRDIRVRANPTNLLPNAPMNAPDYREEHGIVARPGEIIRETSSYTREEWDEMDDLRVAYYLLDSYGVLRYVARFVRRELGMGEVQFYDRLRADVRKHPLDWPVTFTVLRTLEGHMAPPGSWGLFIAEIRRYLLDELGLADDSALRTTLQVQLAHLPGPDREFPQVYELDHDFAAWQELLFQAREEGFREDWHERIPRLAEMPAATLTVRDPNEICARDLGKSRFALDINLRTWELDSPIARARLNMQ